MTKPRIVCFGDSNTWGYDPRGYFGGRYDHPWPEILAGKLGCTVVNRGENGREIPQQPADFSSDTDLLIVMLGTNDLLQGVSPETVRDRMAHFLGSMEPEKLLLIAPPPLKMGEWVQCETLVQASKTMTAHYRSLSERLGISFADAGQWDVPLAYDGVHLTGEGHRTFAEALYKVLIQNLP